jgi:hypothetical protein
VANALVENQFNGHARIGAGKDSCEWFLLFDGVRFQNGKIAFVRGHMTGDEPLVAGHPFGQCFIRRELALCLRRQRGRQFQAGGQ